MTVSHKSCKSGHRRDNQKGISLFVVISALLILSVLTTSITAQLMAPTFAATSAMQQITRQNNFRSALQILRPIVRMASIAATPSRADLPKLDGTSLEIEINGETQAFLLQDVNGLVDVNSASQSLLTALLNGLGLEAHLTAIVQRRANTPFKSVEAVAAFLELEDSAPLIHLITVNSGKRRINSQTAPIELLQVLAGQTGNRTQLIAQINRRFFHVQPVTLVLVRQK